MSDTYCVEWLLEGGPSTTASRRACLLFRSSSSSMEIRIFNLKKVFACVNGYCKSCSCIGDIFAFLVNTYCSIFDPALQEFIQDNSFFWFIDVSQQIRISIEQIAKTSRMKAGRYSLLQLCRKKHDRGVVFTVNVYSDPSWNHDSWQLAPVRILSDGEIVVFVAHHFTARTYLRQNARSMNECH